MAHELAHQFFGNLVTCDWWSDIWFNEGFSSFLEVELLQHVRYNQGFYCRTKRSPLILLLY